MAIPPKRAIMMLMNSLGDFSENAGFIRKSPVIKTVLAEEKTAISPAFASTPKRVAPGWRKLVTRTARAIQAGMEPRAGLELHYNSKKSRNNVR